jgi:hypothetical protein
MFPGTVKLAANFKVQLMTIYRTFGNLRPRRPERDSLMNTDNEMSVNKLDRRIIVAEKTIMGIVYCSAIEHPISAAF